MSIYVGSDSSGEARDAFAWRGVEIYNYAMAVWEAAPVGAAAATPFRIPTTVAGIRYLADLPDGTDFVELRARAATVEDSFVVAEGSLETSLAKDLLEADVYTDKSEVPWQKVWMKKGTGIPGDGIELQRKILQDVDGVDVGSTNTVIGRMVEP